jgi:hypothetical protein
MIVLKPRSPIERMILDYLTLNPEAQDTLRGIVEWWVLKQRIVQSKSDVEAAVASLVAKGKLSEHVGIDGQKSYRLSAKRSAKTGWKGRLCPKG